MILCCCLYRRDSSQVIISWFNRKHVSCQSNGHSPGQSEAVLFINMFMFCWWLVEMELWHRLQFALKLYIICLLIWFMSCLFSCMGMWVIMNWCVCMKGMCKHKVWTIACLAVLDIGQAAGSINSVCGGCEVGTSPESGPASQCLCWLGRVF